MIEFTVHGNPVAQGRPKFYRRGTHVGAYDPAKSKDWKSEVRRQAIEQKVDRLDGALYLILHFKMPRPKSLPKKVIHHVKKPDLDNLTKAIKDALKGVAYRDDSQIIRLAATKEYGDRPGVDVKIMRAE